MKASFLHSFNSYGETRTVREGSSLGAERVGGSALAHSGKGRGFKRGEGNRVHKELKFYFETLSSLMEEDFDSCNHDTIHVLFIIPPTVHSYLPQTNSSLLRSLLECLVMSFSLMWHWLIYLWFPWRRFSPSCFQPQLSYIFSLYPATCRVLPRNIRFSCMVGHSYWHFVVVPLEMDLVAHEAGICRHSLEATLILHSPGFLWSAGWAEAA